jgi:hypothetical protein
MNTVKFTHSNAGTKVLLHKLLYLYTRLVTIEEKVMQQDPFDQLVVVVGKYLFQ